MKNGNGDPRLSRQQREAVLARAKDIRQHQQATSEQANQARSRAWTAWLDEKNRRSKESPATDHLIQPLDEYLESVPALCDRCGSPVEFDMRPAHIGREVWAKPCRQCFPDAEVVLNKAQEIERRAKDSAMWRDARKKRRDWCRVNIPPHFRRARFRTFEADTPARAGAVSYLSSLTPQTFPVTLVLGGNVGVGKTHLTAALVRRLAMKYAVSTLWVGEAQASGEWRSAYGGGNHARAEELIEEMIDAEVLLIDDFGKAAATDKWLARMYQVIDTRLNEAKPTVVTTNATAQELETQFGPATGRAIVDRLGSGVVLPIDGESYRSGWTSVISQPSTKCPA